jgi:HAMP domain-containing protein
MFAEMYVEEKLRELKESRAFVAERRRHADPNAEVPRTAVGRVHEVFRRIAEGGQPSRALNANWRWTFAAR